MVYQNQNAPPTVVISAANGFLGRHLSAALVAEGYRVIGLVRAGRENDVFRHEDVTTRAWDGKTLGPWKDTLGGAAAVVNLVGRTVDCVKTEANKAAIMSSRVDSVRVIGEACRAVEEAGVKPPGVWLQAGTAHIIGDPIPQDTVCDDDTEPPDFGMAPIVGKAWESAFDGHRLPSQRGVMLRISFVLGTDGGALRRLVPITRWGLGGTVGSGRQWMSWLHIDDLNRMWIAALRDERYRGTYMATAPRPVDNRAFMKELRRACGRPWSPPAPAIGVKIASRWILKTDPELALLGRRVVPSRLIRETGFGFRWPELGPALRDVVARRGEGPVVKRLDLQTV